MLTKFSAQKNKAWWSFVKVLYNLFQIIAIQSPILIAFGSNLFGFLDWQS